MALLDSIVLAQVPDLSVGVKRQLIERYGNASAVLAAAKENHREEGADHPWLEHISKNADVGLASKEMARLQKAKAWGVGLGDDRYPFLLSQIPDPPLVLFGRGRLPPQGALTLGVVGPRKPSTYGARVARWLSSDLATEGFVLVSGLARGIDAIAHEAALKAGVSTVAVLGCGLGKIYPQEHAHLMERIAVQGAVVTEFFWSDPPRREHFPQRNRIISGLSLGVVLVEAGEKSGARITARHAMEQSREVFAVPGPIDAPLSFGPNRLIAEGAKLVSTSEDIIEEFKGLKSTNSLKQKEKRPISLSLEAGQLLEQFVIDTPIGVDDLARRVDVPLPQVMQMLTELEMKGAITRQPDATYVRVVV